MNTTIKVILPANQIPLGSRVTKKGGDNPYVLRDQIRVFGGAGEPQVISAMDETRLMVSENGDANIVAGHTELIWLTDRNSLWLYCQDEPEDP